MWYEGDDDASYDWCTWKNPQRIGKGTEKLTNQRTNRYHPDYSIIKSLKDLGELADLVWIGFMAY